MIYLMTIRTLGSKSIKFKHDIVISQGPMEHFSHIFIAHRNKVEYSFFSLDYQMFYILENKNTFNTQKLNNPVEWRAKK